MKPTFDEWLFEIHKCLAHPFAINCIAAPGTLEAWHKFGAHPIRVANLLNERWQVKVAARAKAVQL